MYKETAPDDSPDHNNPIVNVANEEVKDPNIICKIKSNHSPPLASLSSWSSFESIIF